MPRAIPRAILQGEQPGVGWETDRQGQPGDRHRDRQAGVEHTNFCAGAPDPAGQPELEEAEEEAEQG